MILPMKKICLVVQEKNQTEALHKLREIGVIHLERTNASSESLAIENEHKAKTEDAIGLIQTYKAPKKKKSSGQQGGRERRANPNDRRRGRRASDKMGIEELEPYSLDAVNAPVRPELTDYMMGMSKVCKEIEGRETVLTRERLRIAEWGDFDPHLVTEMADLGLPVFLYEFTPEAFTAIPRETRFIKISADKVAVRILALYSEIPGIAPFRLPEKSLAQIDAELAELKAKLEDTEERIRSLADRRPALEKEMTVIQSNIDFESARAEFGSVEETPDEYGLSYLKGYIPAEDLEALGAAAAENGWAYTAYEPGLEDDVPTKLKNNKFASLLSPVADFLGIVPGYRELDISGWFMMFFCIFFGMIFADGGYGMIMVIIALVGIYKTSKNGVPLALKMFLLLSIFSVAWGVLTCSWFGISAEYLPQFLKNMSLSYFSTVKGIEQIFVDQNLMLFCFSLAVIHLTIARIIRVIYAIRDKSLKVLSEIGSIGMIWGMFNVILFLMVSNELRSFPLLPVSVYLLAGGFLLNLLFGAYERSIGQSIVDGLKNFISVVLGVTGVFSDIMSYIRLWAVGLAGASISTTVNAMAGPILGSFLVFAGVILLVFGHGLNMIINVLSVLVHGVRLNILEFSSHVKLNWSGTAYKPFTVKR